MTKGNEIAVRTDATEITRELITEYMDSFGLTANLTPPEKKMFFNIAREFGLNPFKREIHVTAYGKGEYRKCSVITGYEVYIKRADRSGKLNGYETRIEGSGKEMKAVVTIFRKDWDHPFVHEAFYSECVQYNRDGNPNATWAKMPKFMTKKVALGQAFRLCFPDELGGMPYEEAELPQNEMRDITGEARIVAAEAPLPPRGEVNVPDENIPSAGNPPADGAAERLALGKHIGEMLDMLDGDGRPFFSAEEKDAARGIFRSGGLNNVRRQHNALAQELANRKKNWKPIPFGEAEAFEYAIPPGMIDQAGMCDQGEEPIF